MKPFRINILSVNQMISAETIAALARCQLPTDIISTAQDRKVGTCHGYYVEGDDLWALAELEDALSGAGPGWHCESVVAMHETGPVLCAVAMTTLPRGELPFADVGPGFTAAVSAAAKAALERAGIKPKHREPCTEPPSACKGEP